MVDTMKERPRPARKTAAERMARSRHVSLPMPLDERLDAAADKLNVSRSLLLREAVSRGLKAAIDELRRQQRRDQRHEVGAGDE